MKEEIVLTAAQMKALDAYTINKIGIPSMVLMERAALAISEELFASDVVFDMKHVICVCGTGNNGGDGIAVARLLHLKGVRAEVLLLGDRGRCTQETAQQLKIAGKYGVKVHEGLGISRIKDLLAEATTVLDAMFGVGLGRDLEGIYKETVEAINALSADVALPVGVTSASGASLSVGVTSASGASLSADVTSPAGASVYADVTSSADASVYADVTSSVGASVYADVTSSAGASVCADVPLHTGVLSVDIPSGVSADTGAVLGAAVKADKTVVLAYQKKGMTVEPGAGLAGRIVIRDIGISYKTYKEGFHET